MAQMGYSICMRGSQVAVSRLGKAPVYLRKRAGAF